MGEAAQARRRRSGLLKLGIGLAIVVVPFTLVYPSLEAKRQRRKCRETMARLRQLGLALETYRIDHQTTPQAGSVEELALLLERDLDPLPAPKGVPPPTNLPRVDPWGRPFFYFVWLEEGWQHYAIVSAGRDGLLDFADPAHYGVDRKWMDVRPDNDIAFSEGQFTHYQSGTSR